VVSLAAWSRLLRSFTGRKILQEIGKAPPYEEFVYPIGVSGVNLFLVLLNFTKMRLSGIGATGPYESGCPRVRSEVLSAAMAAPSARS
jgi:hypothetical protein